MCRPMRAACHKLYRGIALLCVLLLADVSAGTFASPVLIHVIYQAEKTSHREVYAALEAGLRALEKENDALQITPLSPGEKPKPQRDPPDLLITIGVVAAASVYRSQSEAPILSTLIPQASYRELTRDLPGDHAAILLEQPLQRQLAVARALMPHATRAGLLRSAAVEPSEHTSLQALFGFEINALAVESETDSAEIIARLIAENDVIISTFDPKVYSPALAKWLLYLAFKRHRPIIGFSNALLEAGAAASVFSTSAQIGTHAAELVADWLGGKPLPRSALHPRHYHVRVNAPVAASLGLAKPREKAIEQTVLELLEWIP